MDELTAKPHRVARACNACKLRKVKCNGDVERCQQCSHLNLKCIYSDIKAKPRSKTLRRGSVISAYKQETSIQQTSPSLQPATSTILKAASASPVSPASAAFTPSTVPSTSSSDPSAHSPSTHSQTAVAPLAPCTQWDTPFFFGLVPDYLTAVYPVHPILSEPEVRDTIAKMSTSREYAAFCHAYAAVTINLAQRSPLDESPAVSERIVALVNHAIRIKPPMELDHHATVHKVLTCIFLEICLLSVQKMDLAFFYQREAATLLHMMRIENDDIVAKMSLSERARKQRLYWEVFIHERFIAIVDYRPTVLTELRNLPEYDSSLPQGVNEGFIQIIKIFRLLDSDFLRYWQDSRSIVNGVWFDQKHRELDDDLRDSERDSHVLSPMQQADLIITRQWLRTLLWQLAMSKCLLSLSPEPSRSYMSLEMPVMLSQQLRIFVSSMDPKAIGIHGTGIFRKLFEICDTIADVIIHVPAPTHQESDQRLDDFLFLTRFLFTFPNTKPIQRQILQRKLDTLKELHPKCIYPPP
ncbi:hypothetical protein P152DRAFT_505669 [Eremomyces bilateralis CBS 781.70]|uniref:Zn(2)-C6 fungal-type domain-containing protein n=1 Tax=Eremomyces bilateralis CBS 781.70 TaxID=1392243 RepID=A0A6G1GD36_9PEZI|nr:uncharacterized protein P152DRAFT_505669 [Eremomyces bilateralis CBS 781.70]KAF1815944.1 hypothetical protein P152DRAFT_505669 [Eremomyces bilateralis CBS 781.70]